MGGSAPVLFDILEEHLDEAAFLYQQWEASLRSPSFSVSDIAAGPEERLRAHVDGLVAGGMWAAEELLAPALANDDAGLVFAAASGLLGADPQPDVAAVMEALAKADPGPRVALSRALGSAAPGVVAPLLLARFAQGLADARHLAMVLGYLRVDPGSRLDEILSAQGAEGELVALARVFPDRISAQHVARAFSSPDPGVRTAALESALVLGLPGASAELEKAVSIHDPTWPAAALLRAVSGDEAAVSCLADALAVPSLRVAAMFALGFTGRIAAVDVLAEHLSEEDVAHVAAEGVSAITGLAIEGRFARDRDPWRPEDDEEVPQREGPEAELPDPEPAIVQRWWKERRAQFDRSQRWLGGKPWSLLGLLEALESGPARRRAALATELAIRTRGRHQIAWDALAWRQRVELTVARAAPGKPFLGSFADIPQTRPMTPEAVAMPAIASPPVAPQDIVITRLGAVTPVGAGARQSGAAVRAGIRRAREWPEVYACLPPSPGFDDPEPVVAAGAEHLAQERRRTSAEWLGYLAGEAYRDLAGDAPIERDGTGLFVALPAPRPGLDATARDAFHYHFHNYAEIDPFAFEQLTLSERGGALALFDSAIELVRNRQLARAVVGGVDSHLFSAWLAQLDASYRIKSARSLDGFTPGEGAAFVLVETADAARRSGRRARAKLGASSTASRASGMVPDAGQALTAALEPLLALSSGAPLIVCDLNGEGARMKEWGFAVSRLGTALQHPLALEHPALSLGDLGTAAGPCLVALAVQLLERKHVDRRWALVFVGSDDGERRGVLLERV